MKTPIIHSEGGKVLRSARFAPETRSETPTDAKEPTAGLAATVTADRVEGVDDPTPAGALLRTTIETAVAGLDSIRQSAWPIAGAFRRGDPNAVAQLTDFLDALSSLTALTGALADVAGVDLVSTDEGARRDVLETVGRALERLLAAQQNADGIATANALEEDIVPALEIWRGLFALMSPPA